MNSIHLASSGRLSEDLKQFSEELNEPHLKCSVFQNENELKKNISQFNSFAGFQLPENLDVSHLSWIHSFGAGVDKILWNKTISPDCLITKTLGDMDNKIAEYCLNYILYTFKHSGEFYLNQQHRQWKPIEARNLAGTNALIVGTGFIGSGVARLLSVFGIKIFGLNTNGKPIQHFEKVYKSPKDLDCSAIDVVINTLPLTDKTRDFYDFNFFERFTNTLFINVGRGESVVEEDLMASIKAGYIHTAVLDVFRKEPLPQEHVFWKNEAVLITPHIAAKTSVKDMKTSFKAALDAYLNQSSHNGLVDINKGY